MLDFAHARAAMVERQVARRGVTDRRVLAAMRTVPREAFLAEGMAEFAYEDTPLPIEAGQTISQPFIVGLMIAAAAVGPKDRVLEVGAGSGYSAAVLSRLAREVYAIERHAELAALARDRLARLGYDNVRLRTGDGTKGWREAAPFDAILVAAGGPAIPQALKEQLDLGGRLVIPVGGHLGEQRLIKVTRRDASHFEEEDLGAVTFVPLIGEQGWPDEARVRPEARSFRPPQGPRPLPSLIAEAAEPLPDIDAPGFAAAFDRFADSRVVLLGEASHGTSEFYRARAAITQRLVERHGFNIVALEADWPDAASLNRRVRGMAEPTGAEPPFRRFPTWMWRNQEVEAFVTRLAAWNRDRPEAAQAGVYGLDLYSLSASIDSVLAYLDRVDPPAGRIARERYACLTPWANEPQAYGRMALTRGYAECEAAVVRTLTDLLSRRLDYSAKDGADFLDAAANARLVKNAEGYYRAMYYGAAESWNLRDTHMFETLNALLEARGKDAKAVVWAHNSHIGDASKTEMGLVREELNLGQLCRERYGAGAALIGFSTHTGTVACSSDWDGPIEIKPVTPSRIDSYERLAHDSGAPRFLLDLRKDLAGRVRGALKQPRLERFIGVIYRPETERWSHYSECSLSQQFDAWVWFDQTTAVAALPTSVRPGPDDTWPSGF